MATTAPPPPAERRTETPRDRTLTVAEHLEELRRRLAISLGALLVAAGVSFAYVEQAVRWLHRPIADLVPQLAFFSPTEALLAYIKVALGCGVALAMPVLLWQLWGFVRSALTRRERSYGLAFVWSGSALFLAGAAFAYLVLLPVSLTFLLGIGRDALQPVISIDRYLSFVTTLIIWCGLLFELPAVLFLLARVGIVTPAWLAQQRPYAILVLVILAAIVTPTTDVVSLVLMTAPLLLLYELSILVTRAAMRRT